MIQNIIDPQQNIPLAPLTTLGIGGVARYFVRATSEAEVLEAVQYARDNDLELFILGGGSNILVSDEGFGGLVLQIAIDGVERTGSEISNIKFEISVGAGENWDDFVSYCVHKNLAGIECLSGIPGFVGGTPVQNVGAYGQEVSETIHDVRCCDRETGEIVTLTNAECGFSYRTSIFNSTHRDRYIVLSVTFSLTHGGKAKVAYKDLVEHFAGREPTLAEVRDAVLRIRRSKSMVIDAGDPNSKSAGSFFKNPVVDGAKLRQLEGDLGRVPAFAYGIDFKVPAAWLIENSGFPKGFVMGKVGTSSNHPLALINRGGATASDMIELMEKIQTAVEAKFGISLTPEPVFVGFEGEKKS